MSEKQYTYVLAAYYNRVQEFVRANKIPIYSVRWIDRLEKLRGLQGAGITLYELSSAVYLKEYEECMIEAKLCGFEIKQVDWV